MAERATSSSSSHMTSIKVGIVGQGCAGMATAFHLLKKTRVPMTLDLVDAHPGAGATGVAAGLLHPLAPSGKPLWQGMTSFAKATALVRESSRTVKGGDVDPFWRTASLYRPAATDKQRRQFERNIGWEPREDLMGVRCTATDGMTDGFLVPEGMVLDTRRYLEALWDACDQLARDSGSTLTSHRITIRSLDDLRPYGYDATVIAAGAAVQEIVELRDAIELDLCQGYTVEMIKTATEGAHAAHIREPSILGQPYVAFHGPTRAIVGATQRHGISSGEALRVLAHGLDDASPDAAQNAAKLVQMARQAAPELDASTWHIRSVRSGVRAMPTRTHQGSIPYAGRLTDDVHQNCWIIAGLGARGLVYHALLGELTSAAVLANADNKTAFSEYPELTRWTVPDI